MIKNNNNPTTSRVIEDSASLPTVLRIKIFLGGGFYINTSDHEPNMEDMHKFSNTRVQSFLFAALEKFGFGESFIGWIKAFYTSPKAVTTDRVMSASLS